MTKLVEIIIDSKDRLTLKEIRKRLMNPTLTMREVKERYSKEILED